MTLFPKVALCQLLNVGPVVSRSLPSPSLSNEIQVVTIKLRQNKTLSYAIRAQHKSRSNFSLQQSPFKLKSNRILEKKRGNKKDSALADTSREGLTSYTMWLDSALV